MSQPLPLTAKMSRRAQLSLEALVLCLPCAFALVEWPAHLYLSRDSADYIAAASNLLQRGSLSLFINYTDWVHAPTLVPYLEKPPGLPLLLAPFLALLRDPMTAVLVTQGLCLVFYYLAAYLITLRLGLSLPVRAAALILFTIVAPIRQIHRYFWSETLFLALSMGAAYLAVRLLAGTRRKRDWILFLILLALSATVRYTGVANLALIAPVLLRRDTMRAARRLLAHRLVLMSILVAGGLLVALSLLADRLGNARPGIGPMQWIGIIVGIAGLLFGSAGLVLARKRTPDGGSREGEEAGPSAPELDAHSWAVLAAIAAFAPSLIWLARNRLLYGVFSHAIAPAGSLLADKLWVPFDYLWTDLLHVDHIPRLFLALVFFVLIILPLLRGPILGTAGSRRTAQIVILSAATAHFAVVWSLSLVATVEPIRGRYFSPVLVFLLLGVLNGTQQAADLARPPFLRQAVSWMPLLLLAAGAVVDPADFLPSVGHVSYPRERQLWREIDSIEWTRSSSHFYSDAAYTAGGTLHQIFSGRPQGFLWDPNVLRDPEILRTILSNGVNPFILVRERGYEAGILNEMDASGAVPLERILFDDTGFALYYLGR
jgi:hypothetical protein